MKQVIVSDTHAPQTVRVILDYLKTQNLTDIDSIVVNGDLLGIFSMSGSNVHKGSSITAEHKKKYLSAAAPSFFKKIQTQQLSEDLILSYVRERYEWVVSVLKEFATIKHTIWNMGNHESKNHYLVLQELAFLLELPVNVVRNVSQEALDEVYGWHDRQLLLMQLTHSFTFLSKAPKVVDDVLLIAIPGESHATTGSAPESQIQENTTRDLLGQATQLLPQVSSVIIYNHTQGNYEKSSSTFRPASESAQRFLSSLPDNIKQRVWVQSHNHWSYTQFILDDNIHFVLNNAGLHGGIHNILEVSSSKVGVADVDPVVNRSTELTVRDGICVGDHINLIEQNYPNALDIFLRRRTSLIQDATKQFVELRQ